MKKLLLNIFVISLNVCILLQNRLHEAGRLILFIMEHTFISEEHIKLNETTFLWSEKLKPLINNR